MQAFVALQMAIITVVVLFEIVHIEQQQGKQLPVAQRMTPLETPLFLRHGPVILGREQKELVCDQEQELLDYK